MKHFGIECDKVFNILGWPRSGQHAVANWIFGQLPGTNVFVNNCSVKVKYIDGDMIPIRESNKKGISKASIVCIGREGPTSVGDKSLFTIYVVRDLLNHIASIQKHPGLGVSAKFYKEWEKYIDKLDSDKPNELCISFPDWHTSAEYRIEIWNKISKLLSIDVELNDTKREGMMLSGGGSSFSKMKFNGNASKLNILERYKSGKIPNNVPKNLLELNKEKFGWIYDTA